MDYTIYLILLLLIIANAFFFIIYTKKIQVKALQKALEKTKTYGLLLNNSNKITHIAESMCELLEIDKNSVLNKHVSCIFNQQDKYQIT
ncbi:MAG TPA: hypothetical protein DCL21_01755, partial [Alphaproteobacteria bacterium]|nr:hypothetical protein [Alphaproteobacteria bacterium]